MDFPLDHEMVIDILSSDFGPLVAQVGGYIFANGSRTLADIQRKAGLPKLVAKNCLCILLQHQLAVGTAHEWQGKVATKYKLILNNVYLRAAFPMLLVKIQKKYSENARLIVMGLMLNGIMSKSQILACVNENLPAEAVLPSIDNQDRTEFAFRELCTAFLLIRASKATASASLPAKGDTFPILGSMLPVIPPLPASSSTEATAAGMHSSPLFCLSLFVRNQEEKREEAQYPRDYFKETTNKEGR
ncbi:hypothetical protein Pelo_5464 [Pelomyxa schiedti]|nr:hypothetical protein Pelo_5464 [Pelomyxa schiedti]